MFTSPHVLWQRARGSALFGIRGHFATCAVADRAGVSDPGSSGRLLGGGGGQDGASRQQPCRKTTTAMPENDNSHPLSRWLWTRTIGSARPIGDRPDRTRLFTTLVTGTPEHLLVLLLPHALTALLDQRTHKPAKLAASVESPNLPRCACAKIGPLKSLRYPLGEPFRQPFPGSFNGRTTGFDPVYRGSSPLPGARRAV